MKEEHVVIFEQVISELKHVDPNLPTEVINSINDVFMEDISIDEIILYNLEDYKDFEEDLTFTNKVTVNIGSEPEGDVYSVYTFHGDIEYSISELIVLLEKDELIDEISNVTRKDKSRLFDTASYVVSLIQNHKWKGDELESKITLHIYQGVESANE